MSAASGGIAQAGVEVFEPDVDPDDAGEDDPVELPDELPDEPFEELLDESLPEELSLFDSFEPFEELSEPFELALESALSLDDVVVEVDDPRLSVL
jgi:hypothetical protein